MSNPQNPHGFKFTHGYRVGCRATHPATILRMDLDSNWKMGGLKTRDLIWDFTDIDMQ